MFSFVLHQVQIFLKLYQDNKIKRKHFFNDVIDTSFIVDINNDSFNEIA